VVILVSKNAGDSADWNNFEVSRGPLVISPLVSQVGNGGLGITLVITNGSAETSYWFDTRFNSPSLIDDQLRSYPIKSQKCFYLPEVEKGIDDFTLNRVFRKEIKPFQKFGYVIRFDAVSGSPPEFLRLEVPGGILGDSRPFRFGIPKEKIKIK
jgi:hypothetical protein